MASIYVKDLQISGTELFSDDKTYLNEISSNEISSIYGGGFIDLMGPAIDIIERAFDVAKKIVGETTKATCKKP